MTVGDGVVTRREQPLADDPRRQRRPREGDAVEHRDGESQGLADSPDAVLAQLEQGLDDFITEGGLGIDPELIAAVTARVLEGDWSGEPDSFDAVLDSDARARVAAKNAIKELSR